MPAARPPALAAAFALLAFSRRLLADEHSSLVVAENEASCPPELRPIDTLAAAEDASIFGRYLDACKAMQVKPSAEALISLQLGSERLTLRPSAELPFGDLDLRAVVMLLEDDHGAKLRGLRHLDLSACAIGPAGLLLVSHLLQHPKCELEHLDVSNQLVDRESVCGVTSAVRRSTSLKVLRMNSCSLGDEGGQIIVDFLATGGARSLEEMQIQNNYISFDVYSAIVQAAEKRSVKLRLDGNRDLDQILNSASHCVGEVLAIIGTALMAKRVGRGRPAYQVWSIVIYCAALNVVFLISTLYHAFFALGRSTVYVFKTLDYAGIFLLIAGSYSPFLGIVFYDECWAAALMAFMWGIAVLGTCILAFDSWPFAAQLRVSFYVVMGWVVIFVIRPLVRKLGYYGTVLVFAGGALYSAGIPFLLRRGHTLGLPDHTIWHIFVIGGSAAQYYCVYKFVLHDKEARAAPSSDTEEFLSARVAPSSDTEEFLSVPSRMRPL